MAISGREVVLRYLAAQSNGDIEAALSAVADDAIFDVGRGRYEGGAVREFLERLRRVHSITTVVDLSDDGAGEVVGVLAQSDDDLSPLGLDEIRLDVRVSVNDAGRIAVFRARPTPDSLAAIAKARDAGKTSEGVELARRAGTLPPSGNVPPS